MSLSSSTIVFDMSEGLSNMNADAKEIVRVPVWVLSIVAVVFGAMFIPLTGYIFGAGGKSMQMEQQSSDIQEMKRIIYTTNDTVNQIKSHAEARDEQFKNLDRRMDDLQQQIKDMRDSIRKN